MTRPTNRELLEQLAADVAAIRLQLESIHFAQTLDLMRIAMDDAITRDERKAAEKAVTRKAKLTRARSVGLRVAPT